MKPKLKYCLTIVVPIFKNFSCQYPCRVLESAPIFPNNAKEYSAASRVVKSLSYLEENAVALLLARYIALKKNMFQFEHVGPRELSLLIKVLLARYIASQFWCSNCEQCRSKHVGPRKLSQWHSIQHYEQWSLLRFITKWNNTGVTFYTLCRSEQSWENSHWHSLLDAQYSFYEKIHPIM